MLVLLGLLDQLVQLDDLLGLVLVTGDAQVNPDNDFAVEHRAEYLVLYVILQI